MKMIKNAGYYALETREEVGYSFLYIHITGAVQDGTYYTYGTATIKMQFHDVRKIWFAPYLENPTKSLWGLSDQRQEWYENAVQKGFMSYMERISKKAWDMGASLSEDYKTHIINYLENILQYQHKDNWSEAWTAKEAKVKELNNETATKN